MMTNREKREEFVKWATNNIEGAYSSSSIVIKSIMYDIWEAATIAERERCALIVEDADYIKLNNFIADKIRGG